jgi:uncharacterized protein YjcR
MENKNRSSEIDGNIMSLTTLTSSGLARIQKLVERKESLAEQISAINRELEAIESGAPRPAAPARQAAASAARPAAPAPVKQAAAPRRKAGGAKTARGELKGKIISELKSAGRGGVKVKDLAAKLGTSYGNITAWFQTTGKKMKEVKKVGPAQFGWAA